MRRVNITGYYRPVQNWNVGKAQEYKNRKVYDLSEWESERAGNGVQPGIALDLESGGDCALLDGIYLVTTKNCPNCRLAKNFLSGIEYTELDAENNAKLVESLGIKQAPTLVTVQEGVVSLYANASKIRAFVSAM